MTALDRHRALLAAAEAPLPWYANEHGDIKTGDGDTVLHQDSTLAEPQDAALAAAAVNSHPLLLDLWAAALDVMRDCHPSLESSCAPDVYAAFRGALAKLEAMP